MNPASRSRARKLLFRLGGIAVGLFVGLVLVEGALRATGIGSGPIISKRRLVDDSKPSVAYHCYPTNPHSEFGPAPEIEGGNWRLETYTLDPQEIPLKRLHETPWCVRYDFSSRRLRDREYPLEPAEGVLRIAVVGDSFVFGEGVPNQQSLPRQIHDLLGAEFEVLNGGLVGADTIREYELAALLAGQAHCTRIVFVFIPNDVPLTDELIKRQNGINDLINFRSAGLVTYEADAWYSGRLRTVQLIGRRLFLRRIRQETIQWYVDSYDPRYNGENLAVLDQTLHALANLPDCRVAFVIYPLLEGLESGYPLSAIHERVAAMARRAGLPVLDLAEVFDGTSSRELWVHPVDHHPNGAAHAVAARAIVDWLHSDVPGFLSTQTEDAGNNRPSQNPTKSP